MTALAKRQLRDFNVGSRGITGHYDTMLGRLRDGTPKAVVVLAAWAWVMSWPPDTVIAKLGPVLTVAMVIKLGFLLWSVQVAVPILVGLWYGWRWRVLEHRGLQTIIRNDNRIRVTYYRRRDDSMLFDETTEQQRVAQEFQVNHQRRATVASELKQLALAFCILIGLPLAFWAFPIITGWHIDFLRQPFDVDAMVARAQTHPRLAEWLSRPDVHDILGRISIEGLTIWWALLSKVIPAMSNLGWTLFSGYAHAIGSQYVPGAKVREQKIAERTMETMRTQKVHGDEGAASPAEAARRMSQ
jgi:hypothetical protein